VPANGVFDVRFTPWSVASGPGTQLAPSVCVDDVVVVDGLFQVEVDFGAGPAWLNAASAFVQVDVRPDVTSGNCGGGSYTTLSPRQRVTAAPRSATTRGIVVSPDGKVGLGGFSPVRGLSMSGGVLIQDLNDEGITLSTNTLEVADANDEVAYRYSAPPVDRHDFLNAGEPTLTLASGGFIGLGTQSPEARVHMFSTLNRPSYALIESSRIVPPGTLFSTPARTPAAVNTVTLPSTWTSLDAARVSDGSLASSAATGAGGLGTYTSQAVRFSGFGFAVPSNATITGISITVSTSNQISYPCTVTNASASVRATPRASTIVGTQALASIPDSTPGTATLGGVSQAFGQAWSPAQINDPTFAIDIDVRLTCKTLSSNFTAVNCSCGPSGFYRIDGISVVVHYAIGSPLVEPSSWSVGVGPGSSTFAFAPTTDLSSPSLVLVQDGRVGVGVTPAGNTGPRFEVAGDIRCVSLTETSTERFKTGVAALEGPLDAVLALRPVRFQWDSAHGGRGDVGLIAEEVAGVVPELVSRGEAGDVSGLNYGRVGVLAVGAIQAQQRIIEAQRREVERLTSSNAELVARLDRLEAALRRLEVEPVDARGGDAAGDAAGGSSPQ
jgi:hypothetical protein